jgi:Uma2 family endonuclease
MDNESQAEHTEPRYLTIEEWADLDEDEPGELVDGLLVEEETPTFIHELVVAWLLVMFDSWIGARGGLVFGSEAKFRVGPRRGRKPDVSVYFSGRRPAMRASVTDVPPEVAVEILTARPRDSRRDRVDKMEDYARFGIHWYWIVDPEMRILEIYELEPGGRFARALGAGEGRLESVPGCEGLTIELDALWTKIDALLAEPPAEK